MSSYHPESYWTDLAIRTSQQKSGIIAGDNEPFYEYKRESFLSLFRRIDFYNKSILEVGCGPGENLLEILPRNPLRLCAVDISEVMVNEAIRRTNNTIQIEKTNGTDIFFKDKSFDIVFTVTVLQHNTDEHMLKKLIESICNVSKSHVYLFERTEVKTKGTELNIGHTVNFYEELMKKGGFRLHNIEYINIQASYLMAGIIRKLLNPNTRKEGESLNTPSLFLQKFFLPLTSRLDPFLKLKRGLTMMHFTRQ